MKNYLALLLTLLLLGCSGGSDKPDPQPTDEGKDRSVMLKALAEDVIIPSYDQFKTKFDLMQQKSKAFTSKPDAQTLAEFRSAWADAYVAWQRVELFDFGPAEKQAIRNFYNIYPASEAGIAANIADPASSLEVPASYPTQGFPALDYLLNGLGTNDTSLLAHYISDKDASKKLAYINRVVARMELLLGKVVGDWKGEYLNTFISKTGLDIGSSTSLMVNGLVLHYERYIRSGKFGIPSGAMANGIPAPDKVEAFYKKDISRTLAQTAHKAYADFFNGRHAATGEAGPSLRTYLDALGAKDSGSGKMLSESINTQFQSAATKLDALNPNLYEEVRTNNQAMKDTYSEMQKAVRMLKVDMTSAMSITITYTDNDGD
ncbi:MAG: peptidase M75, Imelysin [Dyadobacter sp. 50-39]|uniref:imelysin family protein n=1 Tax=Dyadobacter sp. 50-39 TaxID=1895756 RepID=UPI000962ED00|nr:imelysin family protein [Dyadobacter sp. 50-39]OJV12662.1 MAG: peptidase M75, Imelysin [Dyadobacter sp. 50-39]